MRGQLEARGTRLNVENLSQRTSASGFDLLDPTSENVSFVETRTGITLPTRQKLRDVATSSTVSGTDGVLFLRMPRVVNANVIDDQASPVGYVLFEKVLVTLHAAAAVVAGKFRGRLRDA
jgi:Mg2+ and Co2+ transporter CorA